MNKIKKLITHLRYGTLFGPIQRRLQAVGIIIAPYYWIQEGLTDIPLPKFRDTFKDYTFEFFGPAEMKTLAESKNWGYTEKLLLSWLDKGNICFGVKYQEEIVAFMWIELGEIKNQKVQLRLRSDEAYLSHMFTIERFRGKGIAPYLRYKSYEILKNMGRVKIYSYSDFFNPPSIKFKKKLNAKFLKVCLYIELFKRYHWNWVIKRL